MGLAAFTFTAAVGAGVVYAFVLVVYRLYFHPLAKYPGPFLAKITNLHQLYHAYHGDRHLEFYRQHEKYGKFYRFGPNALSVNSNTGLQTIYGPHANVQKSQFYSAFPPSKDQFNTHSTIDKKAHKRKRAVLSHAFSEAAIKSMEKYILGNIRTFTEQLGRSITEGQNNGMVVAEKKGWGKAQDMADWCNYLTFDIMGDLCFGKAFNMLEKPDNHFAADLIGQAAHRHLICGTMPVLHEYHLDKYLFPHLAAGRSRYMAYSKAQAGERMNNKDVDRRDFFHYLLSAVDPETGAKFSVPELWGESNLLIIAGSDTTSTALASAFFYLVHNPKKLAIAVAEVRRTFGEVEEIVKSPKLNELIYIRAVLDEGMRMSPPVGGILPREVLKGGITIDGEKIPGGIDVGTPHYTVQHNPAYYPEPFRFVPERWIEGAEADVVLPSGGRTTTKEDVHVAKSAFCPFSVGPRACIGKNLAYAELILSLARTLFLYDIRLAPGETGKIGDGRPELEDGRRRAGEYQLKDSFTSMKVGPMVEFRMRQD